ncbi:hypothetical protein [Halostreptopolyspora alba]|uniref:Uncharacterized protein n=1 Tax=Halostreptopolyspora alba TaxID=2487137 RepID=A0A3N0EFD8_9ACTN|nr:hypothetical protein EFW17_04605 [Nocardiopsaceae bacterium YIM 96095]
MVFLAAPKSTVTLTVIEGGNPGQGSIDISDAALWTLLGCCHCPANDVLVDLMEEVEEKCAMRGTDPTLWLSLDSDDLPARHVGGQVVAVREARL